MNEHKRMAVKWNAEKRRRLGRKCRMATEMLVESEEEVNPGPRHQIHALELMPAIMRHVPCH